MQKYNKERPIIYHNCQCYRKDTPELVAFDPDRACPQGFLFRRKALGIDRLLVHFFSVIVVVGFVIVVFICVTI